MGRNSDGYFYVYILRCADDSYYVGITRGSLETRVSQHNQGTFGGYTDAIAAERRIKGWGRAKKEALIKGDYELLHLLSQQYATRIKS
jgi:predicted GIY-YIG superfamily endonuclease